MEPEKVRAPNIRDVARLAGVSYQTVSRVLNDSPSIRPETRQKVLDVIEAVGYRPNQAARALVTSRSRTIGVLTSQSAHYGPTTSLNAIETAARDAGYRLSVTTISTADYASTRAGLDYLMSQSIEALVVIAPQVRVFDAIHELSVGVPFVTLESTGRDPGHSLSVDQTEGARLAVRHLIDLGHSEILHISGPQDWIEAEARMQGYLQEMNEAELRTRAPVLGDWTAHFGYYAGLELLRFRDFTAVFCGNDQMALGFMHACREMGLTVPGDISIVGFDDIPEAAHFLPPLTTVRQNFVEIGRRAIAVLLGELGGQPDQNHTPITPELIVRASTSRVVVR
ncbi:LacI family DNA-binding transcriptional regulator [Galbitalea soli]|uniref:LacI family DNA-binding transcriptional regulator n=1 Tax=Galbitalea soli TaxID=1268042 RepID=A0A7C9PP60_9MICO|nr:LacI family DNA-binding transcriptional regulator [Galbitalea soli]NEM92132.1 LacI family DNA-binding transcriptional regulator [Galbitalea soli]NYJ31916.1 DNA-binding LacI/PurR family transcriptional regulator [Galbitalea soli]